MQAGGSVSHEHLRAAPPLGGQSASAVELVHPPAPSQPEVRIGRAARVLVFQPALPSYRLGFFERLHAALGDRLAVFYSPSGLGVLTERSELPLWSSTLGPMLRPLPGVEWQVGALAQPIRRGDTVVVPGAPRGLSNLLLLLKARLAGARTLWWGQYWSSTSHPLRFAIRLMLMRLADALIFYTDDEVEAYRVGPGRNERRPVFALNNGIDVEPVAARRAPYVPAEREGAVLFLGRLTDKAEVGLLIEALADPALADLVVHIVGDGEMREALQRQARDLGVDARIHWHGGTVDEDRIAEVANRCRLFVYPGAVGLSLIHAMAYGLPAVVHNDRRRHMPEIAAFRDGVTGRSFVREDVPDLARCLASLLTDAPLLERFSKHGVEVTATRFNTVMMAERFADALRWPREAAGHAD